MDLALNNLQRLICHKTQQTNSKHTVRRNHNELYLKKRYQQDESTITTSLISLALHR